MQKTQKDDNKRNWKLMSWICPKCGKEITSLYYKQLLYNKRVHQTYCKGAKK